MILDRILAAKREEVAAAKARVSVAGLRSLPGWQEPRRRFVHAIHEAKGRCIIAEIKKASPSRGLIRADFDPAAHARDYERAGATCISVLTDTRFFQGSLADLDAARRACARPLLRKDFVVDPYQIVEARAHGADAVLLIVAALESRALGELLAQARAESLDVLTEVHDERELETALAAGAALIGVNNRDLKTFHTTTDVTRRLVASMRGNVPLISESGLGDARELAELESLGVRGFLIGETLMAAASPGRALARLIGAQESTR
jgi:indole-3-glycerol phosphate synthase